MWCKLPWLCCHCKTCTCGAAKWLQLEAGWVRTMVPMQETPLGGSRTFSSWDSLSSVVVFGGDFAPDLDNAPGCWSESSVQQLPSWPCQGSQGWQSWPGMTCWPQTMTCEHVPPTGDWSTSQLIPRPLSSAPFWAAAWWRSTPQVPPLPALSHQHLQWWDTGKGRCNWGHGSTSSLPPHWPLPSATSASPWVSSGMWWSTSGCPCDHQPRGHWTYPWWHLSCPCMTGLPLNFVVQNRGSHLDHHQGTLMISTCFWRHIVVQEPA